MALLAILLRKNRAQVRYWLWLAASVKFLIPFALLVTLGSNFSWPASAPVVQPQVAVAVKQISQPFTPLSMDSTTVGLISSNSTNPLPKILFAVWFLGFAAILWRWYADWRRIRALVRAASPLPLDLGVPVLSSPDSMEPGIFRIWRPVLLLPQGIGEKLAPEQLKAVLAHELCHVRRRDNLAAAIHKLVEAIFWFHPLVWWISARLVEERERACDEEVLRNGSEPQVYAESILKTCKFYLESPSACMSGVTGGELKERIVRIMAHRSVRRLGTARKLLLAAVSIAVIAGPIAFGLMSAPQETTKVDGPKFEVASIKPDSQSSNPFDGMNLSRGGRFTAYGISIRSLIQSAYDLRASQISGGPDWISSEKYDIVAKGEDPENKPKLSEDRRVERFRLRLQSLLADRFRFKFHTGTKELPVYALVVGKNGPKFQKATTKGSITMRRGQLTAHSFSMVDLAAYLSNPMGRVVLDKTGLQGEYDLTLNWSPEESTPLPFGPEPMAKNALPQPEANGPSIFTAIQEQLGLKLESQKGPVEILVIDHVEKPSEN